MKSEQARQALEAARAEANRIGKPVSIAVVDAAGVLVVLERVNDAPAMTAMLAEGKAYTSALTGRDSAQLQGIGERYPQIAASIVARTGGRFLPLQGALTLSDERGVIGAIGVSGATSEEDEQIARAGARAIGAVPA